MPVMPTVDVLAPFAVASLVLAVLPGPNVVFLLARGAQYGGWSAWRSAVGVETATLVLGFATAFGVGALIAASALAFQVLKWAGVAYLCWLGLRTLRERPAEDGLASIQSATSVESLRRDAMRGFVVGVTNPKVALFLVAFLPQFVRPGASATSQMVSLTVVFAAVGLACDGLWCLAGSGLRQVLRRHLVRPRLRRVPAVAYFGLAGWLATTGHRPRSA
jgi:threonine/homoserine/homoserine lactone efflux protein